ncbi:uroporphyrinogen-III synthase [Franzmannia pantelleriensis]|uniref:Uroporphyrinogen-III synthase n=1 Tax=Franzmannia pantelleriensis TaxID=48727 RepID=A0A1G9TAQ0_9GAMM|nr:uroporphyrinogen-III synthase [Halomonas pantelleriensis]SDM44726.1 uroporphyrinogen-III synthase [Halomonas pantelleriensis]
MALPILLTRPGERGARLAAALAAQGQMPQHLEVMGLEALDEDAQQRSIWLDIDQFSRIVVVSPYAAERLAEALDRYWPQLPLGPAFYAVGQATAETLHRYLGVRVHVPPPGSGDTSEDLLTLPSLARLDEQKVLLVAGEGGRPLLAETLAARGARVTRLALYRRVMHPPRGAAAERLASGDYAALVISSGELLEYLAGWCQSRALNQPLIVSSRRLATLADSLGFTKVRIAGGASVAALSAAVEDIDGRDDGAVIDHDDLEKG